MEIAERNGERRLSFSPNFFLGLAIVALFALSLVATPLPTSFALVSEGEVLNLSYIFFYKYTY
jgi:hypothetical protein